VWLDESSDLSNFDWSNTIVITEHNPARSEKLPIRDDVFYVVHGLNDNQAARERFQSVNNRLSWNVYHDYSHVYGTQGNPVIDCKIGVPLTECMWIAEETPLYPKEKHMDFRWATDLLPHEIEANKPDRILGQDSNTIWYVGTQWWVNQRELNQFKRACDEARVTFQTVGAGQNGIISVEDNIDMVRRSLMAPAISGSHHLTEGYVPCRIFKNISYGQYGITNSLRVHQVLGLSTIYNPDPYELFFEARSRLKSMDVKYLHAQMDVVAQKHTYVNRINAIIKAARILHG
jgi:hypothetical protein